MGSSSKHAVRPRSLRLRLAAILVLGASAAAGLAVESMSTGGGVGPCRDRFFAQVPAVPPGSNQSAIDDGSRDKVVFQACLELVAREPIEREARFRAGHRVVLGAGFRVAKGARLVVEIEPTLSTGEAAVGRLASDLAPASEEPRRRARRTGGGWSATTLLARLVGASHLVAQQGAFRPPTRSLGDCSERDPSELYFCYQGAPRNLGLVDHKLMVQRPHERAASLRDEVLARLSGWRLERESDRWSLFSMSEASGSLVVLPQAAAVGPPPRGRGAVEMLVREVPGPFVFSPVLLSPRDFELAIGSVLAIRVAPELSRTEIGRLLASYGGEVEQEPLQLVPYRYLVRFEGLSSGFELLELANVLTRHPDVVWAEPSFTTLNVRPSSASECVPLSPLPTQTELDQNWWDDGEWGIRISGAWDVCGGADASGNALVTVGVMGDGVDLSHPDLYKAGQPTIQGRNFVNAPPGGNGTGAPVTSCDNHETAVTGMMAMGAAAGSGGVGAAPRVRILSARVREQTNPTGFFCEPVDQNVPAIINGLDWLVQNSVKVINYSWKNDDVNDLTEAFNDAAAADVMIFAAVGNHNNNVVDYPASLDSVIGVGGNDEQGHHWSGLSGRGSAWGPGLRYSAPAGKRPSGFAGNFFTTDRLGAAGFDPQSDWTELHPQPPPNPDIDRRVSGTSYATPLVAAVAALIRAARPELSASQVDEILCETARELPLWDDPNSSSVTETPPECGLVDAQAALEAAVSHVFTEDFETGDVSRWTEVKP